MNQCMRFPTMWYVRPAKPQIRRRIDLYFFQNLIFKKKSFRNTTSVSNGFGSRQGPTFSVPGLGQKYLPRLYADHTSRQSVKTDVPRFSNLLTLTKSFHHFCPPEPNVRTSLFVCLFDLILYVPSTIFQLNRDGSSWVEPVLS